MPPNRSPPSGTSLNFMVTNPAHVPGVSFKRLACMVTQICVHRDTIDHPRSGFIYHYLFARRIDQIDIFPW
jgi:hypothetical protein